MKVSSSKFTPLMISGAWRKNTEKHTLLGKKEYCRLVRRILLLLLSTRRVLRVLRLTNRLI